MMCRQEYMVKIFLKLFFRIISLSLIILSLSCRNDFANAPINKRLSLDTSSSQDLSIKGAFPSTNPELALAHPLSGDFYLSTDVDGPDRKFEIVLNNPLGDVYSIIWKKDGIVMSGADITNTTTSISVGPLLFSSDPSSLNGVHSIEVFLYRGASENGNLIDGKKWLIDYMSGIEIFSSIVTSAISPSNLSPQVYSKALNTQVDFTVTITDPHSFGYYYRWYLDDVLINDGGRNGPSPALYSWYLENVENADYTLKLDIRDIYFRQEIETISWTITVTD